MISFLDFKSVKIIFEVSKQFSTLKSLRNFLSNRYDIFFFALQNRFQRLGETTPGGIVDKIGFCFSFCKIIFQEKSVT